MPAVESNASQPQLPDERFWVKYSPHHELPVSGAASLLWHVAAIVGMFVLGLVVAWNRPNEMPIEAVQYDGEPGGGGTGGTGTTPGQGGPSALVDAATPNELPRDAVLPKTPLADIKDLHITPADILNDLDRNADATRDVAELIQRGTQSLEKIAKLDKALRDGLINGGTPGSGGGSGGGNGTGIGPGDGPGTGTMNQRTKRKLRWTIMFNTNSNDYLHQLEVLEAILSFRGADQSIFVAKNLTKRPVPFERSSEDELRKLNRIFWIDDNSASVEQLMRAMGRSESPSQVVALFPLRLESELLAKEKAFRNREEDSIVETRFQILMRGSRRYEIVVVDQRYK